MDVMGIEWTEPGDPKAPDDGVCGAVGDFLEPDWASGEIFGFIPDVVLAEMELSAEDAAVLARMNDGHYVGPGLLRQRYSFLAIADHIEENL